MWFDFCNFLTSMKYLNYIICFLSLTVFGQESLVAVFIKTMPFEYQTYIGQDNFGSTYAIDQTTLYKINNGKTLTYSNFQLGNITSANTFNPLKINVFYRQKHLGDYVKYILTSTQSWGRPLEIAKYHLIFGKDIKIKSISYPPSDKLNFKDKNIYNWEMQNFMPEKEFEIWFEINNSNH